MPVNGTTETSRVHAVAIITPAPGKKDRIQEVLLGVISQVEQNEPDTLQYQLFWVEESAEFVFLESYKDDGAVRDHQATPYLQELREISAEEALLAKPLEMRMFGLPVGGFAR
ncbi:hypothetical protein BDW59DRAFT_160929 [Aspergillus cavernicola]|uniref:ABM domain-containing protein n=1 Tax=Aspergillus cavernicola TaxID=176166 RepID=A0ABR4IF91_9EURO